MTSPALTFINGFTLSAALIIAIGAQNMFVLRQGLKREHVGAVVLFCSSADALLIASGVGGLGALLKVVPSLMALLTFGGVAFLGWYGIAALRRATAASSLVVADQPSLSLAGALGGTAAFTFLNPHVYLDTVLLMGSIGAQRPLALRPVFVAGAASASLLWFSALGYGARLLTPLFAQPVAWRILDLAVGATMLMLSLGLLMQALGH